MDRKPDNSERAKAVDSSTSDRQKLARVIARVESMPPPQQLRLAAMLLERGERHVARGIVARVLDELRGPFIQVPR